MKIIINILLMLSVFGFVYLPIFRSDFGFAAFSFDFYKYFRQFYQVSKMEISKPSFDVSSVSQGELSIRASGGFSDYPSLMAFVLERTSFSEEDFKNLKRDNNNKKILSVEELAKRVEIMGLSEDLKKSLEIWARLDQKTVEELKTMPINPKLASAHGAVIAWYKYHAEYAKKLADKNFSKNEIKKINEDYLKNAKSYLPGMQRKLAGVSHFEFSFKDLLVNNAQAQSSCFFSNKREGGFFLSGPAADVLSAAAIATKGVVYDFGGRVVTIVDFDCIQGIPYYIGPPKGGCFFLYYPIWSINPFLYNMVYPGIAQLGKSIKMKGKCTKAATLGLVTYDIGDYSILYFGSSLLPAK